MFDFPSSPSTGQIYTSGGISYQYNGYAWLQLSTASGSYTKAEADAKFVELAGDTMSGNLTVSKTDAALTLNQGIAANDTNYSRINFNMGGSKRWEVAGAYGTEAAGNDGSDFSIDRYDNSGAFIATAFSLDRKTGDALFGRNVTADAFLAPQLFAATSPNAILAASGGAIFLRPGGSGIEAGQATIDTAGTLTVAGDIRTDSAIYSGWLFGSLTANICFAGQGGTIYLRPNGGSNGYGEMTVDAGGNVGISGQASLTNLLAIKAPAGGNAHLYLQDAGAGARGILYWRGTNDDIILSHPANGGYFSLENNGRVQLARGFWGRNGVDGGRVNFTQNFAYDGAGYTQLWVDNTMLGNIATVCDYRIKKDVAPLPSTWEVVRDLNPISYTHQEWFAPPPEEPLPEQQPGMTPFVAADDVERWGFIAHELQETLLPSAAHGEKDAENQLQSPDLMAILAALTRTVQEAQARIEALEAA